MNRPIADDVLPYLDLTPTEYIHLMKSSKKTVDAVMLDLATGHSVFFPDRRDIDFTLDHVDTPTSMKYGTRSFSDQERAYVRSISAYKSHPKKLRPDELSVGAEPWLELTIWGGDEFHSIIDQPKIYQNRSSGVRLSRKPRNINDKEWQKRNSSLIHDMKGGTLAASDSATLFASEWKMNSEITSTELILLLAPFFAEQDLDITLRDFIPSLSNQYLRGLVGLHSSKYHAYQRNMKHIWERIRDTFDREVAGEWFVTAQAKFPKEGYNDSEPVTFGADNLHYKRLSRDYTAAEVAPLVVEGYPVSSIMEALKNDIDLYMLRAVMNG